MSSLLKYVSFVLLVFFIKNGIAQIALDSVFKLKWKTEIGLTTYKTNIQFYKNKLYVGSNGYDYDRMNDPKDGVFEINPITGAIENQFVAQQLGDNDVNGIAINDNKIYFGGDNFYFYCFDLQTKKEVWKFATPYDVESCPVLTDVTKDGKKDVIFTTQNNGVFALNGSTGKLIWKTDSINCYNANSSPTLWDVNNDGTMDVIVGIRSAANSNEVEGFKMKHYGDYYAALNGKNGKIMWLTETGANIASSGHIMTDINNKQYFIGVDSYGEIRYLDKKGQVIKYMDVGYSVYSSLVLVNNQVYVLKNEPWENYPNVYKFSVAPSDFEIAEDNKISYLKKDAQRSFYYLNGRISASPVALDLENDSKVEVIVLSESGEFLKIDEQGDTSYVYHFSGGAEATPFIADVDGDGKMEMLIASLDGYLYCYETGSKTKPIIGDFRQGLDNSGIIR